MIHVLAVECLEISPFACKVGGFQGFPFPAVLWKRLVAPDDTGKSRDERRTQEWRSMSALISVEQYSWSLTRPFDRSSINE